MNQTKSTYILDNGVELPRVSTILREKNKDFLLQWAANQTAQYAKLKYREDMSESEHNLLMDDAARNYQNVSGKAMSVGKEVHRLIETHIRAVMNKYKAPEIRRTGNKEIDNCLQGFKEWECTNVKEYIDVEKFVFSIEHGFAGRLDFIVRLNDDRIYIFDIKCASGIYDENKLQLSAYGLICPTRWDSLMFLRLDKLTGTYEQIEITDYDRKVLAFLYLTKFYYTLKKRRLQNNKLVKGETSESA